MLKQLKKELGKFASEEKSRIFARFFKTGKGQYGHGDVFLGLSVPQTRSVARKFLGLDFEDIQELLLSKIHEERLCALMVLVGKYEKSKSDDDKKTVTEFYLRNSKNINNWDLVDLGQLRELADTSRFSESGGGSVLEAITKMHWKFYFKMLNIKNINLYKPPKFP